MHIKTTALVIYALTWQMPSHCIHASLCCSEACSISTLRIVTKLSLTGPSQLLMVGSQLEGLLMT